MSCKAYAESFVIIAERKGYQTISFDLPEHEERSDRDKRCDDVIRHSVETLLQEK